MSDEKVHRGEKESEQDYLTKAARHCRRLLNQSMKECPHSPVGHLVPQALLETAWRYCDIEHYGVEGFCDAAGRDGLTYLNNGRGCQTTICYWSSRQRFYVASWADMLEMMERRGFKAQGS